MEMEYRRLGGTGLKVSVLSFGSWVTFGPQLAGNLAEECLAAAYDAGVNFFDNAEAYAGGESETDHGRGHPGARLAAPQLRDLHQALLGPPQRRQHAEHPQPQVPDAGHRRLARAARSRLRGPGLLPPARSRDPDRGDGVGHVGHDLGRQGPLLGHVGVVGRGDPRGLGHRRAPPPAQARGRAAPVQPAVAGPGGAGVRPPLRRHRARPHHLEPPGLGPADRQVPRRRPRGLAGLAARLRVAAQPADRRGPQRQSGRRCKTIADELGLHPGPAVHRLVRRRTRTSRRSSPGPAGWSRCTRTWPLSRSSRG